MKKGLQAAVPLSTLLSWRAALLPKGHWHSTMAWRQGEDEATAARSLAELFPPPATS